MAKDKEKLEAANQELPAVCENCESCMKMIGLGLGYKCADERNNIVEKMFAIPHRNHTCEHYTIRSSERK